ncbi:hypothetical protein T11_17765 [Trichinella zimbabwensis]|uniref:Uncharacterized protein n=1 Tax=Trichinella zimbabwensis TaxID=268475 RepID=A0A0V1G7S4_9BILA|nr:hypothetical protein T11_17765 [Trichinella zimbabwensis]
MRSVEKWALFKSQKASSAKELDSSCDLWKS